MNRTPLVHASLALMFILFAGLQYNDPDPWVWIPIYLMAAVISIEAARGKTRVWLNITAITLCSAYAVWLFFIGNGVWDWATIHDKENLVQTMKAAKPWIENTREFGGLLIVVSAAAAGLAWRRKPR